MRGDKLEIEIPQLDNFNTEIFSLIDNKYKVINSNSKEKQIKLIEMCNRILDKEYTDFNKDIEESNKFCKKQYFLKQDSLKIKSR